MSSVTDSRLNQVVAARLGAIRDMFRSGLGELTGKARRIGEGGNYIEHGARFRGVKDAFPELEGFREAPGRIAKAIERGKGPLFRQVRLAVRTEMFRHMPDSARRRLSVGPHEALTKKCVHCHEQHTSGEHRFHGRGSWLQTHLFPYRRNPKMDWTIKKARQAVAYYSRLGAQVGLTAQEKALLSEARQYLRRSARPAMNRPVCVVCGKPTIQIRRGHRLHEKCVAKFLSGKFRCLHLHIAHDPGDVEGVCMGCGRLFRLKDGKEVKLRRSNPSVSCSRRSPVKVYGRLLRIEAKKTGVHRCDASCRKAGHSYYHDFASGAVIYGMSDGSLLVKSTQGRRRLWNWF